MDNYIELSFASEPKRIRAMVRSLLAFLGVSAEDELRLIFSELIHNAVTHGNNCNPEKKVLIRIVTADNKFSASIQDEGTGFDYASTIETVSNNPVSYEEHGRGVLLVKALCE